MNKPYFAKWLTVEGKIEEGDFFEMEKGSVGKVISIDKNMFSYIGLTGYFQGKKSGTNHVVNLKQKMQLFLCSRDIQVGDEYTCPHKGKGIDVGFGQPKQVAVWMIYTKERNLCSDCFKVIGEISPNATWVKERDEFDEDEIYRNMVCPDCLDQDTTGECTCFYQKYTPIFLNYSIKGPCGYFH
jgi:hypothetical protein